MGVALAVVVAFGAGAASVWLYQRAADYDATAQPVTLKGKLMERKSRALEEIMDAVVRGHLPQVPPALARLEGYASAIDGYLDTDVYRDQGQAYARALQQMRVAIEAREWVAAKEATLALERSCLDCHQLLLAVEP